MKKNYITPEINVIQLEALCGGLNIGSVHREKLGGECVDTFDVLGEDKTKDNDSWGESHSDKWGDD